MGATRLASEISTGALTASAALEAHLDRIARLNPDLNAVVQLDADAARQRASELDRALEEQGPVGPLHGVPMTVKDTYDVAGLRTTFGMRRYRSNRATRDATAVARLRGAGVVIMGKSNLAEMAFDWQSDNPVFGRTVNPWDRERTPGGSSGGGAAAVAARLTPLELGGDGAGSLRVPAHFCGVSTIKPTKHMVPGRGHLAVPGGTRADRWSIAGGPMARSTADLRVALGVIVGPDGRSPDVPPVPFNSQDREAIGSRRLVWTDGLPGLPVTADTRRTLETLARRLSTAGWTVERIAPDIDVDDALLTSGRIMGTQLGVNIPRAFRLPFRFRFGRRYGQGPWVDGIVDGLRMRADTLLRALDRRDEHIGAVDRIVGDADGWLLPVASVPAFTHRATGTPLEVDGHEVPYTLGAGGYATIFNLTGHPVVVFPAGASSDDLPIGVQLVGRRWGDGALLDTAEVIEALGESEAHRRSVTRLEG